MSKNYLSIYAKSFNWAGYFLSKETYNDCSSLYDFCRTVDNIADNEDSLEHKKVVLHKFKKKFYEKDFSSKKIGSLIIVTPSCLEIPAPHILLPRVLPHVSS